MVNGMITETESRTAMEKVKTMIADGDVEKLSEAIFVLACILMTDHEGWIKELSQALKDAKNARL